MIIEIEYKDLDGLMNLYLHLHEISVPKTDEHILSTWEHIINDYNYHIIVAEEEGIIVSSCTCIVVPNLTRNASSYALVENVVTHSDYRGKGLATSCLMYAKEIAKSRGCYKMMLITGSSNPKTHDFYQNAGYSSDSKTAYYCKLQEVNWKKV